jgi:hypothetical protein
MKAAGDRQVADLAAVPMRVADVDEPILHPAMHRNLADHPFGRRGIEPALQFDQPQGRSGTVPFLAKSRLSTRDAAGGEFPEDVQPVGAANHQHHAIPNRTG